MTLLHKEFIKDGVKELKSKFGYTNPMEVPKILKVSLNMGVGEAVSDSKVLEKAREELELISGQKAMVRRAKKSIAGFKLREGMGVGCSVTLRGERMFEFLDRLIIIALPRVRDFRGLSKRSFNKGNYSLGIKEQIVFPEIDYDKIDKIRGLGITIVTSANTSDEAKALLECYNFPFI